MKQHNPYVKYDPTYGDSPILRDNRILYNLPTLCEIIYSHACDELVITRAYMYIIQSRPQWGKQTTIYQCSVITPVDLAVCRWRMLRMNKLQHVHIKWARQAIESLANIRPFMYDLKCLGCSLIEYNLREDACPWQTHARVKCKWVLHITWKVAVTRLVVRMDKPTFSYILIEPPKNMAADNQLNTAM